ncbi:unnamed protein product [Owenia fusiformis]|uniref:Cation/H+ exchanger transmembrane domain-containing protein n=1 Tax=Owenia fusiformis TaxID=6347 RepID=A0A8J1XX81_OWEFU|nr:unnamed protein product [Owenia fusiformis]
MATGKDDINFKDPSMEFDDYPLDLISPITTKEDSTLSNLKVKSWPSKQTDSEVDTPSSAWRPTQLDLKNSTPLMKETIQEDTSSSKNDTTIERNFDESGALTLMLLALLTWGTLWAITGEAALPGGNIFGLVVLGIACFIGGLLISKLHLPPLLGMLVVGCLLRNIRLVRTISNCTQNSTALSLNISENTSVLYNSTPGAEVCPYYLASIASSIEDQWSSAFRNIAFVVVLIQAGLGLDPKALRKLSCVVIRLAFMPCMVECAVVAVASHLLLSFPWEWGFMLGFVLAAVTPAVIVPSMLSLQTKGYGYDQGIPTLVIAASSIDDVLAISGFTIVLAMAFTKGDFSVMTVVRGPLEAVMGLVYGSMGGVALWYFPHKKHRHLVLFRFLLLFGGGLFGVFGSRAIAYPGAGPLGALTIAFVAALRWRSEGWTDEESPMNSIMDKLWLLFQPLLFGLIGAEIDVSTIQGSSLGLAIAVMSIGLAIRMVVSFLAVFGVGLSLKEKFFIPFAWLPKATVQAAIGSVALDTARDLDPTPEKLHLGQQVLTIAVLAILITAPLGGVAIALMGPRLLKPSEKHLDSLKDDANMDNLAPVDNETVCLSSYKNNDVENDVNLRLRAEPPGAGPEDNDHSWGEYWEYDEKDITKENLDSSADITLKSQNARI